MSVYTDVGSNEALAVLAEARANGTRIGLAHRGAAAVALYAVVREQGLGRNFLQRGRMAETGLVVVDIPNQSNFDANIDDAGTRPIMDGDVVEVLYGSGRYFTVSGDMEIICNGFVYRVTLTEKKTASLGAKT